MKISSSNSIMIAISKEEALIIKELCDSVYGQPDSKVRKITDKMSKDLAKVTNTEGTPSKDVYFSGRVIAQI